MDAVTVITALYLLVMVIRGYRRGLAGSLFSMIFLVLVIATTAAASPSMTKLFQGSEHVTAYFDKKCRQIAEENEYDDPDSMRFGRDASSGDVAATAIRLALGIAGVNAISVSDMRDFLIKMTATIAAFVVSFILWLIVRIMIGRLKKVKGIGTLDRLLGIPLGGLQGLITIWVILTFISMISFTGVGARLAGIVRKSPLLYYLSSCNLISYFVGKFVVSAL